MKALNENAHNHVPTEYSPQRIGIIGGKGSMGQLLEREFIREGYEVITTGEDAARGLTGRNLQRLNRKLARQCDVIVLSVPISDLTRGIETLIGTNLSRGFRGKLFLDVCSTKAVPVRQMRRIRGPSVIGMHPMFGPAVTDFRGSNVIICPAPLYGPQQNHVMQLRLQKWINWIEGFWQRRGAVTVRMGPEDHDRTVPSVQFDVLIAVLAYASVLKATGANFDSMERIATPNSRLLTACVGRMLDESMISTYANLAFENPHNLESSRAFEAVASRLRQLIATGDRRGFIEELRSAAVFVERNGRAGLKSTASFLQKALANREVWEDRDIARQTLK